MSQRDPSNIRFNNHLSDSVAGFVDGIARLLLYAGGVAAIVGVGVLLYQFFGTANAATDQVAAALQYQDIFRQAALYGMLVASIGAAWLFWEEEVSGPILLIVGFLLALMPWYVPIVFTAQANELQGNAVNYLAAAGYPAIVVGFCLILADAVSRVRLRIQQGAKAEQVKYGKGMREERDVRNVFLGKCWQLPYCRKFVRERCPIYHSKRTCWKERVGCMCEESVIKNAMEGNTIPADIVAAAKYIPRNSKLTPAQKAERCRQCIIYNEHQKHKYQLLLPVTMFGVVGLFASLWSPLSETVRAGLRNIDRIYEVVTVRTNTEIPESAALTSIDQGVIPYHHIILGVFALVALAYAIKLLEFFVWKLKV